jgi:hypothetical protein
LMQCGLIRAWGLVPTELRFGDQYLGCCTPS